MKYREMILRKGFQITPEINRDYFFSLYLRKPGGVLFEITTGNPGFTVDEPLGESLMFLPQYEALRTTVENKLPVLN